MFKKIEISGMRRTVLEYLKKTNFQFLDQIFDAGIRQEKWFQWRAIEQRGI
jgi:hypothetical protein